MIHPPEGRNFFFGLGVTKRDKAKTPKRSVLGSILTVLSNSG